MTLAKSAEIRESKVPQLRWTFFFIISGFVLCNGIWIYWKLNKQNELLLIARQMVNNRELVYQLSHDLDKKRHLVEAHILESEQERYASLETEIAKVDARIDDTLRAAEPIAEGDPTWNQLRGELAALQPDTERILDLSRRNRDTEANAELLKSEKHFEAADEAMDGLLHVSRARTEQEVALIQALQSETIVVLVVLSIAWTIFALLALRWLTRLISRQESQITEAMENLEEQNRDLDAFAGRVAHDLRGTLAAINLAASIEKPAGEGIQRPVIKRAVKQMDGMIQDLLTLSRVGAQVRPAICDTANVAAAVEEDLAAKVEAVGGALHVEVAAATVSCSEGLLRQALWNLGENAVKYRRSEVQLKITIRGQATPDGYEFAVSDNGIGMTAWETRQAFEPFFRGKNAQSSPGTGLGLSIVKRVIEASGGSVSADSVAGQGTTVKLEIPLASRKAA